MATARRRENESDRGTLADADRHTAHAIRPPASRAYLSAASGLQHSAPNLIEFDRLEKRLEVSVAETGMAFALNDFKENRADDILRENLQQHTIAFARIAVDEDRTLFQRGERLPMSLDASFHALVIRIRRALERDAVSA